MSAVESNLDELVVLGAASVGFEAFCVDAAVAPEFTGAEAAS